MEGIGIALDLKGKRMFVTDLGGSIYCAKLNGSDKKTLLQAQGNVSGIAYSELSSEIDSSTVRLLHYILVMILPSFFLYVYVHNAHFQ
jgi:hypothetical protein